MRDLIDLLESSELTFRNEHSGYHHGQHDYMLVAMMDGSRAGYIDYIEFEGEISIRMIETVLKRRGVATALVLELQRLYPNTEIETGMTTSDGSALFDTIPCHIVVDQAMQDRFDELAALHKRDTELEKLSAHGGDVAAISDEWNRIHDRLWELEDELRGKKPTKRIFGK